LPDGFHGSVNRVYRKLVAKLAFVMILLIQETADSRAQPITKIGVIDNYGNGRKNMRGVAGTGKQKVKIVKAKSLDIIHKPAMNGNPVTDHRRVNCPFKQTNLKSLMAPPSDYVDIIVTVEVGPKILKLAATVKMPTNVTSGISWLMAVRVLSPPSTHTILPEAIRLSVSISDAIQLFISIVTHVIMRVTATIAVNLPFLLFGNGQKTLNLGKALITVKNR
jgi:hypothetical protein